MWDRFNAGEPGLADTLRAIRDTVLPAAEALVAGDWRRLGELATANREAARRLDAGTLSDGHAELFAAAEAAGAHGGKPCGAGGGGCAMVVAPPDRRADVERAARGAGATLLPFRVADAGANPLLAD